LPSSSFARDDQVYVVVVTSDGEDTGSMLQSNTVVIGNSGPVVDTVALSPSEIRTSDVVQVLVSASDADGDPVTLTYTWQVNGLPVVENTTDASLDGTIWFDKGDYVSVIVLPSDGSMVGIASPPVGQTVMNSAPSQPQISLQPSLPPPMTMWSVESTSRQMIQTATISSTHSLGPAAAFRSSIP
jgi:hypothetical protein